MTGREPVRIAFMGIIVWLTGLGVHAAAAAAALPECDRNCLEAFADRYFSAMMARAADSIPGASSARYSEDSVVMPTGEGLWATFTGLGTYRILASDPATGQVAYVGTIRENDRAAILALRLKVAGGRLREAEAVVHRNSDEAAALERMGQPDSLWTSAVQPDSHEASREQVLRAAGRYFEGLLAHDGHLVPFAADCNRIVDGAQDTNNPNDRAFLFGTYNPAALDCTDNLSSPVWSYQRSIEPRRFPLVDVERGLAFGVLMFNHPGNVLSADLPGIGKVPMPDVVRRPSTVEIADLFKVEGGKIRRLQAVSVALPYLMPDGWSRR